MTAERGFDLHPLAAQDITENRPALSRWHADHKAAFEESLRK